MPTSALPVDTDEPDRHGVVARLDRLGPLNEDELVNDVFGSEATSPSVGTRKALLVVESAKRLAGVGVDTCDTVAVAWDAPGYGEQKRA